MINFTVGPVQTNEEICKIGGEQVPYFRTPEFSSLMLENEKIIKKLINANEESKVAFITGSGTASMEATIANVLTRNDKVLVVNGGTFGQRFVDLCEIYKIPYTEIKLKFGSTLKKEQLEVYNNQGYTALLVNIHETSSGVLYDIEMLSDFCKRNNLLFIVDAISAFLADSIDMKKHNIDVMITGSQKALACPPGVSIIVLSKNVLDRINNNDIKCMYLNLKLALENAARGQTPFTPAVGILRQINARLNAIENNGGAKSEIEKTAKLANYFRNKIKNMPFEIFSESLSNAVTALYCKSENATKIFEELKNNYDIWICPNGGEFKEKVIRVGHIGDLTEQDYDKLIDALNDLINKQII